MTEILVRRNSITFPQGIGLQMTVIERLDFELIYEDVAILYVYPLCNRHSLEKEGFMVYQPLWVINTKSIFI